MAGRVQTRMLRANGADFGLLEAGSGPLALCLHGFPDCAYTWRWLLPSLAEAGFHAVAPFMRGYAPTSVPADARYGLDALVTDALALHEALGGDPDAVLIGHDWGAEVAYGAVASAPERWRTFVTLAVPPASLDPILFADYDQLRRSFYLFMFRDPRVSAERVLAANEMEFIDRLWRDWSPGFDPREHLVYVKASLREPANLGAALGYYRAHGADVPGASGRHEEDGSRTPPRPSLYLHGDADGCIGADLVRDVERFLAPGSAAVVIQGVGHFLHLERPQEVNGRILAWITGETEPSITPSDA